MNEFRLGATTERAHSERELTEAALLLAEADRLDRDANDVGCDGTANESRSDIARDLADWATEYERRADAGGDDTNTAEELRELAADARSQAEIYRDMDEADQSVRSHEAPTHEAQANRAEAGVVYDSADRRHATVQQMESVGVAEAGVRVRARVDVGHAQPAAKAVAQGALRGDSKRPGPQVRGPQRSDRTR